MPDSPMTVALDAEEFKQDRYGFIEHLRAQSFYARTPDGGMIFYNQEDVAEIFKCRDFRFHFEGIDETKSPYLKKAIDHELLNMHGVSHDRLSRLVKIALRERIVGGMRQSIEAISRDLTAAFPDTGEVEFCADFADPLPSRVLGPMFDVPYVETEGLNDWIKVGGRKLDALQTGVGIEKVEEANRRIHTYLRDLLSERRENPGEDLFSELIQAEIDGDRMSEDEIVYLSAELASAGVDTTRTQLPLILLALLQHPDELEKLRADPGLALRAVDEGMRFAPLPWAIPHQATGEFEFKGLKFRKGDVAYALVPGANRDPSAVKDPQNFNITREGRTRNFSFGAGMHACPGAQLARMEMSVALHGLVSEFSTIRLLERPDWEPGHEGRGLRTLKLHVERGAEHHRPQ
ncbi:cytochrome P450 [uncultured Ruegeria sp.]|uniref:cytochrome P450 n=1 Tax=uncultured Ruegeria sp. TaxID=259304 RepID=UPI00261E961E|nr:cytochrome P450 [uncultured Ruegeria sp.]